MGTLVFFVVLGFLCSVLTGNPMFVPLGVVFGIIVTLMEGRR